MPWCRGCHFERLHDDSGLQGNELHKDSCLQTTHITTLKPYRNSDEDDDDGDDDADDELR